MTVRPAADARLREAVIDFFPPILAADTEAAT
jgi:hypothetical protein